MPFSRTPLKALPEPDNPLEVELAHPLRKIKKSPTKPGYNSLSADAERERRRHRPNSKAKKYDGRGAKTKKYGQMSNRRSDAALRDFYKEIEMPELKMALQTSNDPKYGMLLAAINDPRFNNCSFTTLCKKCRMSLQDIVDIWRNHQKTKGLVKMMAHMPDIMEDVAVDSKSRIVICNRCQGEGRLQEGMVNRQSNPICPDCHGDGKIRIQGDKDARNLAFETVGLKKNSGGVNITNINSQAGVPSLEDQLASIDNVFDADFTVEEDGNGKTSSDVNPGDEGSGEEAGSTGGETGEPSVEADSSSASTYNFNDSYDKPDPTDYSS
jgi:hypothetical protein